MTPCAAFVPVWRSLCASAALLLCAQEESVTSTRVYLNTASANVKELDLGTTDPGLGETTAESGETQSCPGGSRGDGANPWLIAPDRTGPWSALRGERHRLWGHFQRIYNMPFAKRLVEPQLVCRHYIPNDEHLLYEDLVTISNVALSRTLRQLSDLAKHACSIFQELESDLTGTSTRVRRLHGRISRLQQTCGELDSKQEAVQSHVFSHFSYFSSDLSWFRGASLVWPMEECGADHVLSKYYHISDCPPPLLKRV
uniref:Uncharacterized protein n=1 Tax=Knipowitschia caucasica TaxID=637954 RepID=A0AAV2KTS2_KNICA